MTIVKGINNTIISGNYLENVVDAQRYAQRFFDFFTNCRVIDTEILDSDLITTRVNGDAYYINGVGLNEFAGKDGQFAVWRTNVISTKDNLPVPPFFEFYNPSANNTHAQGFLFFNQQNSKMYLWFIGSIALFQPNPFDQDLNTNNLVTFGNINLNLPSSNNPASQYKGAVINEYRHYTPTWSGEADYGYYSKNKAGNYAFIGSSVGGSRDYGVYKIDTGGEGLYVKGNSTWFLGDMTAGIGSVENLPIPFSDLNEIDKGYFVAAGLKSFWIKYPLINNPVDDADYAFLSKLEAWTEADGIGVLDIPVFSFYGAFNPRGFIFQQPSADETAFTQITNNAFVMTGYSDVKLRGQGDVADDLETVTFAANTINTQGYILRLWNYFPANGAITIKNTGNFRTGDGGDYVLSSAEDNITFELTYDINQIINPTKTYYWKEISRSKNDVINFTDGYLPDSAASNKLFISNINTKMAYFNGQWETPLAGEKRLFFADTGKFTNVIDFDPDTGVATTDTGSWTGSPSFVYQFGLIDTVFTPLQNPTVFNMFNAAAYSGHLITARVYALDLTINTFFLTSIYNEADPFLVP